MLNRDLLGFQEFQEDLILNGLRGEELEVFHIRKHVLRLQIIREYLLPLFFQRSLRLRHRDGFDRPCADLGESDEVFPVLFQHHENVVVSGDRVPRELLFRELLDASDLIPDLCGILESHLLRFVVHVVLELREDR